MSFPPLRTSSPLSHKSDERVDAATAIETEPFIKPTTYPADNQQDITATTSAPPPLTKVISPEDYSRGTATQGPIHLEPDSDEAQTTGRWYFKATAPSRPIWDLSSEDQGTLNEMGRGALIIVTTPIAFTGMALYACGMIIEGIGMLLKGVGSLGGKILMKRRRREESPSVNAQWV